MKTTRIHVVAFIGLLGALTISQAPLAMQDDAAASVRDIFSRNDRLLIARSIAEGGSRISLILASEPISAQSVAAQVRGLGGSIRYEADELGYLRIDLPTSRLPSLQSVAGIIVANVSPPNQFDVELSGSPVRRTDQDRAPPNLPDGLPTPSASTGKINDFTGVGEVGAAQFIEAHPTYDGRGVRIAIFEPVEPDLPFLQNAFDLNGRRIPKLVERRFTTDPRELDTKTRRNFGWVMMRAVVRGRSGTFTYDHHRYTVPCDGLYRFGIYTMRGSFNAKYFFNTRHPHGTSYGGPLDFGVLWDEARNLVWVDTNQDGDFAEQPALADYGVRHDYGVLHLHTNFWNSFYFTVWDKPAQAPDTFPFVVQTDREAGEVGLFLSWSDHAAMVASSAAGQGFYNGAFDGMAPGAQLLSFDQADDYPYFIESMIAAAREHVDIMSIQFGVTFNFDSGRDVWDEIARRLVRHYDVIVAVGASNDGPAMTTIFTPSVADGVLSIGGYVRGKRIWLLRGAAVSGADYIADYSSRGPRGDGGLKPNFLAPTEWLAGSSSVAPPGLLRQRIALPVGYDIGGGTSQATPSAAGAIALLVSAAKQARVPYSPRLIGEAIAESARVLPRYQAYEQGAGLINVPKAWEALKRLSHHGLAGASAANLGSAIGADAPVVTARSGDLATPGRGPGLYEREGWHAGMHSVRVLRFTRTTGGSEPRTFDVRWIQNDGTFRSPGSLTLPLGESVGLPVSIYPQRSGVHSAFLELVDPRSRMVALRQLNTIVAADQFSTANNFTIRHTASVQHPGIVHYFVNVPPHTDMLSIALNVRHSDTREFFRVWTDELVDVHMPDGTKPALENLLMPFHDGDRYSRAYPRPPSGVWEIVINNETPSLRYADASKRGPLPPAHLTFSASVFGMRTVSIGRIASGAYRAELLNAEAPFHPRASRSDLGIVTESTITLSPLHQRAILPIDVPKDTSEVAVIANRLGDAAVPGGTEGPTDPSDADIYLFNCGTNAPASKAEWLYQGSCEYKAGGHLSSGGIATTSMPAGGSGQALELEPTPPPGRWIAVIDASKDIVAPLTLGISRIIKSHRFGTVTTTSMQAAVPTGGRWVANISVLPSHARMGNFYVGPIVEPKEADTIYEILPSSLSGEVLLKAKPIVKHTHTPIWLMNVSF